ncbi:MAG: hypothetical protein R6V05_10770 [Candidatus Brocadiia bacterium]
MARKAPEGNPAEDLELYGLHRETHANKRRRGVDGWTLILGHVVAVLALLTAPLFFLVAVIERTQHYDDTSWLPFLVAVAALLTGTVVLLLTRLLRARIGPCTE